LAIAPRGDDDAPGYYARAPFIVTNSRLPKQTGQTIRA
jgi:hypothetical protein